MTNQVGQNALNTKDKPVNKIIYADNTTNHLDGQFHGQRLNDVVLNYDAATSTITATYAGKTWKATTDDLGIDKSQKYNFLITSSHMQNRYSDGIMRTNLEGVTITTPQADLIDDVEVTKQPIPHKTIREFDPTLEPGSPDVIVQKGEDGETTTTPTKVDPDTGDVVERGEPTTEVTKIQLTRLYTLHLKKYHKVIKMSSIQTYQLTVQKKYQVNQASRILKQVK